MIKSIVDLTTVGKYVFDNAKSVLDKGEFVPYNCFWMFEKGLVTKPYDKKLYQLLFGMDEKQLYKLFSGNDANTVYKIANTLFRDWTTADNDRIFKKDASKPWLDETTDPEK